MATYDPSFNVKAQGNGGMIREHGAAADEAVRKRSERSLTGHLSDLTHEAVDLLRQEIALAKAEVDEKITVAKRGAVELATGGAILAGGLLVLLAAAVLVLGLFLPYWVSALIVGGVTSLIGAVLLGQGKKDVSAKNMRLDRTIEELRRDKRLIKEHM